MRFLTLELKNTELESPYSEEHMFCGRDGELPLIPPFLLNIETRTSTLIYRILPAYLPVCFSPSVKKSQNPDSIS